MIRPSSSFYFKWNKKFVVDYVFVSSIRLFFWKSLRTIKACSLSSDVVNLQI